MNPPALKRPAEPSRDLLDQTCLEALLGFHVRLAHTAICRDFIAKLKGVDLTQRQGAVLMLVRDNPGSTQMSLSNTLQTDRATIMDIVDRLEKRGLIERRASQIDRRRQELFLTGEGAAFLQAAVAQVNSHDDAFRARFTPAELELLFGFLRRIAAED